MTWGIFKYNTFYVGAASFVTVSFMTLAWLAQPGNQQVPPLAYTSCIQCSCCTPSVKHWYSLSGAWQQSLAGQGTQCLFEFKQPSFP